MRHSLYYSIFRELQKDRYSLGAYRIPSTTKNLGIPRHSYFDVLNQFNQSHNNISFPNFNMNNKLHSSRPFKWNIDSLMNIEVSSKSLKKKRVKNSGMKGLIE